MTRSLFFGWRIVLVSMIGMSASAAPLVLASLGLFMEPWQQEFGWNRVEISVCLSILMVSMGLTVIIVGRLVDRYGAKKILLISLLSMGLGVAAIPTFVTELWHLWFVFLLIGICGAGTNTITYMPVLAAWFDRYRGLAIGIAVSGFGLGYAYVPLVVQASIERLNWRAAYYWLCAIVFFVAVPLVYRIFRETPAELGLKPDGMVSGPVPRTTRKDVGLEFLEVLRTRVFWVLMVIFFLLPFTMYGMFVHLVPMLMDRGLRAGEAAMVAAIAGGTVFIARVVVGFLVDRYFAPRVGLVAFALSTIGLAVFASGLTGWFVYLAAALIGITIGAESDLVAYLSSRYFGIRALGGTYGILGACYMVGAALGPVAFGAGFESSGSYMSALLMGIVILLVVIALTTRLKPFPDWESSV